MANVLKGIFKTKYETSDVTDELGKIHIFLLFISGVIWGFLAVNNVETTEVFKISLVYSILLILGLAGIAMDRGSKLSLGIDSALWNSAKLQKQLIFAAIFSIIWYIFFINGGLFLAVPLSISAPTFAVSPVTKFFLVTVLGPIAENVFFFAVLNFTIKLFIRQVLEDKDRMKAMVLGGVIFFSQTLFTDLPLSNVIISAAAILVVAGKLINRSELFDLISAISAALLVGGAMFPIYHSSAYQLDENNFLAAIIFGIMMCLIASIIGLLPVDIVHIANNTLVLGS